MEPDKVTWLTWLLTFCPLDKLNLELCSPSCPSCTSPITSGNSWMPKAQQNNLGSRPKQGNHLVRLKKNRKKRQHSEMPLLLTFQAFEILVAHLRYHTSVTRVVQQWRPLRILQIHIMKVKRKQLHIRLTRWQVKSSEHEQGAIVSRTVFKIKYWISHVISLWETIRTRSNKNAWLGQNNHENSMWPKHPFLNPGPPEIAVL